MKKKWLLILLLFIFLSSANKEFDYSKQFGNIEVFFTQPFRYEFGKNPIENKIINYITNAKKEIVVMAFDFDSSLILESLVKADKRGVRIQIICDKRNTPEKNYKIFYSLGWLKDYKPRRLMHNKLFIIDKEIVITGSMNFTINGLYFNNNNILFINDKNLGRFLKDYFNYKLGNLGKFDYKENKFNLSSIEYDVFFTDFDYGNQMEINDVLVSAISKSQNRIGIMYSTFTNLDIAKILYKKRLNGVSFLGLIEYSNSFSKYSVYNYLVDNGMDIYRDFNERMFHHKVLITDDLLFTGSYAISNRSNIDKKSLYYNDEVVLVFHNKLITDYYYDYLKYTVDNFCY